MVQNTKQECSADSPESQPLAVSIPEAARLLSISERQVYYLMKNGEIPFRKLGRSTRIPLAALHAMMNLPA